MREIAFLDRKIVGITFFVLILISSSFSFYAFNLIKLYAGYEHIYGWTRTAGSASSADYGNSIATDSSGNVFTTGYFGGTVDFDDTGGTDEKTSAGSEDIFITKYNADGTYGWTKALGGANDDRGQSITTNSSGDVFVTGYFYGTVDFDASGATDNKTSAGGYDIFITKYNADGTYGWTKTFGTAGGDDSGNGVITNSSGDVFVTGYFQDTVDFDASDNTDNKTSAGGHDIFITKYNADGTYGWTKTFGGGTNNDYGQSITTNSSGDVFVTGYFAGTADFNASEYNDEKTSAGESDIFITKYNADGTYGWTKAFGGTSTDYGSGITTNSSGDVFVTGYFIGTVDFDASDATDNKTSISGTYDTYITKYNADGTYGWTKAIGGTSNDYGYGITTNSGGDVFVTGYFIGTVDFDASGATDNKTSAGSEDIFITKYSADGSYGWTKAIGGGSTDIGRDITTNSDGDVFATGIFQGTADFDASAGTDEKTSAGSYDAFITKYTAQLDVTAPTITNITSDRPDGTYGPGEEIDIDVTFSEAVTSTGDVTITLETGDTDRTCTFTITNTFTGTCTYTVQSGDTSLDLNVSSVSGTIKDQSDNAISDFTPTTNLSTNKAIVIDPSLTDTSGYEYAFSKAFGGTDIDVGYGITTNSDGDVFVTGYFTGTADFDASGAIDNKTSAGSEDIFITKYNADGTYGWTKTFGGTSADIGRGITTNFSGDVFVSGYFVGTADFDASGSTDEKTSAGSYDIFITKYNADGTYGWTKALGGTSSDYGYGITTNSAGDVFVTGNFADTVDFDASGSTDNKTSAGDYDIFITKYNADGTYGWTKALGGTSTDYGYGITTDSDGYVFVTGFFADTADFDASGATDNKTSVGGADTFITKYNADGTYGWTKTFGGTSHDYGQSITTNSDGDVFVTGYFYGTVDFDASGATDNKTSAGGQDIFITKYNADGTYGWTKAFGGASADISQGITTNSGGDVFVTGYFAGTADFDASGSTDEKTSAGENDIFITKYNANGTYGWTKTFGETSNDLGFGITTNSDGDVFVTGYFTGTVDFYNIGGTDEKTSAGSTDIFITKYTAPESDATAPTITSVSSDKTNGTYTTAEVIDIDVTFSEAVTSTGDVTITLETGDTDRTCTFTVSNSTTGTCNYTVQAGDTTSDLTVKTVSGTIADQSSNPMTDLVPTTNLAANKALVVDTTAPTLSSGLPSGTQVAGTTGVTLSLTTDETSTCKYGTVADTAYASIANTFSTTNNTTHSQSLTGLSEGNHTYYIRCQDESSNPNTSDYTIAFSIPATGSASNNFTLRTPPAPSLTVYDITDTTLRLSGNYTSNQTITDEVGFTYTNNKTEEETTKAMVSNASGGASFNYILKDLSCNTEYTFKAYAKNSKATTYSTEEKVTTDECTENNNNEDAGSGGEDSLSKTQSNLQSFISIINNNRSLLTQLQSMGVQLPPQVQAILNQSSGQQGNNGGGSTPIRDLETGMEGSDVKLLQILLNNNGYILTPNGPGSIGNETERFGAFTRNALIKYQTDNQITPPVGYFGPITRAKMKLQELIGVWW